MTIRFTETAGRIIISKPGYEASSALPDSLKIFDSNWGATGMLAFRGAAQKILGQQLVIPFPFPLHYVPAAEGARGSVTNSSLIIDADVPTRIINWRVWAISQ
ncbi:hypothetical protein REJC140_00100 [Pseudorhizobium endolithicum]|uniref:Uncharacterized protein n=1 Tax=Pseudorhizobium endolithicum TaxID=1191678 RepID=A0ABM8PCJ3_9HYPH|nr:hypothetical protein [Pseudorhizobium endolithicum]CAD7023121.1 hypothetical protein REJC140_00100 [Pseudorhizobium endolithicum]